MSSFEAVVDAVRDEGMSLRQQLAAQAAEQESPAVRDAKEAEDARRQENTNKLLEKIANDVASTGKSIDISASDEGSGFGGFIKKFLTLKKLLIGGAIALAVPVIIGFLNSDLWKKLKTTIKEDIIPALQSIYKIFKEDIYPILEKTFLKQIKLIQGVIKDISAAFNKMASGDFLCGLYDLIVGLGSFIGKTIDNISTGLYNIIAKIFGLEETDSVYGSLSKFFTGIKNDVSSFITDIVNTAKNFFDITEIKNKFMNSNLVKYVKSVFGDLFETICGIFAGDFSMKNLLKGGKALLDIVQAPLNIAINAIKDIFKFGDPNEPFRLSKFITDVVQSIVCWFEDNFSWEKIKSKIESGLDIVKSIGDTIANTITSVADWFKENFTLDKLLENSPTLKKALQFAGVVDKTAGDIEAEIAREQSRIDRSLAGENEYVGFEDSGREDSAEKIKELQAELTKLQNAPNANVGGITTKQGLVNIHPQEAIIPLEKMDEVIDKINTAALSKTGGAAAPVQINNVTHAPVDASSSSVTNAATMPISPPTNYVAIL